MKLFIFVIETDRSIVQATNFKRSVSVPFALIFRNFFSALKKYTSTYIQVFLIHT